MQKYIYLITILSAIGGALFGFSTAIIAGAGPFIETEFSLGVVATGRLVSILLLGACLGAVASGKLTDNIGRKRSLIISASLYLIGLVGSASASSIEILEICRLITGFALGISSFAVPLYISEIAPPKQRGMLVIVNSMALTGGIVIAYIVSWFLANDNQWREMFAVGILPAGCFLLALFWMPESPKWLITNNKAEAVEKLLKKWLPKEAIDRQIQSARGVIQDTSMDWQQVFKPPYRGVVLLGVMLAIIQQACGINVFLYYAPKIFATAGFSDISSQLSATIGLGLVNFLMTGIALWLVDKIGRRFLLIGGLQGMTLLMMAVAYAFAHIEAHPLFQVLLLAGVIGFVGLYAISIGCLFWLLISELYPIQLRGTAMSLATAANWIANFFVTLSFPILVGILAIENVCYLYACACFFSMIFSYLYVPETKAVTLEQIESNLKSGFKMRELGVAKQ